MPRQKLIKNNLFLRQAAALLLIAGLALSPFSSAGNAEDTALKETAATVKKGTIKPPREDYKFSEADEASEARISLDLKDVEIVELLRVVSLKTGKTIVPTKEIAGRITLFLNDVAFSDLLDIILLSQNLAFEKKGYIYYIMTNAEYKKLYGKDYTELRELRTVKLSYANPANIFNSISQVKSEIGKIVVDGSTGTIILIDIPDKLEVLEKTIKELDKPLDTKVFDINYAKPSDAKTQLAAVITPGTGEVIVDERSSKAIVTDMPRKMEKINNVFKAIDEETRQICLEADIVEVYLSDKFQRGIDWEKLFSERHQDGLDFIGNFPVQALTTYYQTISVGSLTKNNYNVVINFLNTYGDTKIVSQPRINVVNNEEAKILVGTRDAYITQTQSQGETTLVTSESIEFVDVGVKLRVVPTINSEGFITMKIKPEVSSIKETITTEIGSRVPIVQTSEAETVVKVKDGTMIMIGGLMKRERKNPINGWPWLAKLPVVGALFGTRSFEDNVSELIIFITPTIIKGDSLRKGTEPETLIPEEVMPYDIKEKIRQRKLKEIKMQNTLNTLSSESKQDLAGKIALPKEGEITSPLDIGRYYQKALELQRNNSLYDAAGYYKKILRLDNKYAPAYNQLGIIYEAQGLPKEAERMYLKAIEVDPDNMAGYSNMALLSEAGNDPKKAMDYWRKRASLGDINDPWTKEALEHLSSIEK